MYSHTPRPQPAVVSPFSRESVDMQKMNTHCKTQNHNGRRE
jgi:hypothetical protein